MNKILYVRSGPYQVDPNSYNLQELGLASAFYKYGYQCDVMYYHKEKDFDQVIEKNGAKINVLWRHGIRLLRSGVYPQILKKDVLDRYDFVICSEYSQIMSVLLCKKARTYIYNGPYYNLFKIPFIEPMYDALFCKYINRKAKKIFCKTEMASDYIAKKGMTNTTVTGVALDIEKFEKEIVIKPATKDLLDKMLGHRNFLYIGSIIKRKNIELLVGAFVELKKYENTDDVQLVLIGKGDKSYTEYCSSLVPENLRKDIVWCSFIENAQTKFVYQAATAFLLPSIKEIFGMVLLEAMYFYTPVISSHSAGAGTLIKSGKNGIIVEEFDKIKWAKAMWNLINGSGNAAELGKSAGETIRNEFMWDGIAKKMLREIEHE